MEGGNGSLLCEAIGKKEVLRSWEAVARNFPPNRSV